MRRRTLIRLALPLPAAPWGAAAWALQVPRGPVILTIRGAIGRTNAGTQALLDDAMLAALPQHAFSASTPWYDGPRTFRGPRLADVLSLVEARGRRLAVTALDGSGAFIPVADAQRFPVILTREIDGRRLTARDRGPLFLVYPYDSSMELRTGRYFARSVWQLKAIEVER